MAVGDHYIVNFEQAVALFQHRLASDELPIIDLDVVKWRTMQMFEHIEPLTHLHRLATEMVQHEWLYSKVEFVDTTPMEAERKKIQLNQYLRDCIVELGNNMYARLKELGMLSKGTERYQVITRPLDNETYTLRQNRS
jgi:hypothetical protein